MYQQQVVQEIDVLIEVIKWLHADGWTINRIGIPDYVTARTKIARETISVGINLNNVEFRNMGEDIIASRGDTVWKIECKGLSSGGKYQPNKENFDRAVANIVSYYTQRDGLRLGIALPEFYKRFFPDKLPQSLRLALNLWIFIYRSEGEIRPFAPNKEVAIL